MIAIVVFSSWEGYRTGFVAQVVRLLGTVIAYISAWKLHAFLTPTIAHWLLATVLKHMRYTPSGPFVVFFGPQPSQGDVATAIASAISFGIVFYLSLLVIRYVGYMLNTVMSLPVLSFVNRLAGLAAGFAIAIALIAVLLSILSYVPASPLKEQLAHSKLVPMFKVPVRQLDKIESTL